MVRLVRSITGSWRSLSTLRSYGNVRLDRTLGVEERPVFQFSFQQRVDFTTHAWFGNEPGCISKSSIAGSVFLGEEEELGVLNWWNVLVYRFFGWRWCEEILMIVSTSLSFFLSHLAAKFPLFKSPYSQTTGLLFGFLHPNWKVWRTP